MEFDPKILPDEELAVIAQGDGPLAQLAFGELWDRYNTVLCRSAVKWANGNSHDADDLMSRCRPKTWDHRNQFDPERGSWIKWAFGVLRGCASEQWREKKQKRGKEQPHDFDIPIEDHKSTSPETEFEKKEISKALNDCLNKLSEDRMRSEIFLLYQLENKTFTELAETFGITIDKARRTFEAAREKMEYCMRFKGYGPEDTS